MMIERPKKKTTILMVIAPKPPKKLAMIEIKKYSRQPKSFLFADVGLSSKPKLFFKKTVGTKIISKIPISFCKMATFIVSKILEPIKLPAIPKMLNKRAYFQTIFFSLINLNKAPKLKPRPPNLFVAKVICGGIPRKSKKAIEINPPAPAIAPTKPEAMPTIRLTINFISTI